MMTGYDFITVSVKIKRSAKSMFFITYYRRSVTVTCFECGILELIACLGFVTFIRVKVRQMHIPVGSLLALCLCSCLDLDSAQLDKHLCFVID